MKQITISNVKVREIIIRPNDETPILTVFYEILNQDGAVVTTKQETRKLGDLPQKSLKFFTDLFDDVAESIESKEL